MADMKDIVKLAVDASRGTVENYTVKQSQDVLRQALVEANNGKTTMNYRDIRDGKCAGLFALIEEILSVTIRDGLQGDEFFNNFVEYRNVALGDQNLFLVEDNTLYVVDEAAEGTQGIRRQRLAGVTETPIPTTLKIVRIYEELNRVLAGRVDFNTMIAKVSESFRQQLLNDIYTAWIGVTAEQLGGTTYFPAAGSYNEDTLLELIAHVEAAAGGQTATILGTKKAVRNLQSSILAEEAKGDLYKDGHYGYFFGTPVVVTPQRHKVGTTEFVLDDNMLTIVAGAEKPIKVVTEGDPIILLGDPMTNADFTQEFLYAERTGCGIVVAGGNAGIGRYEMTT